MKSFRTNMIMLFLVAVVSVGLALAAEQNANVDEISDGSYTGTAAAGSNLAEGGNVTSMNLTTSASTSRWAGYYGNVSGTLALGIGTDVFYDFGTGADVDGVFASTNQSFNFAALQVTTAADIDAANAWNFAAGNDQAVDVFVDGATSLGGVSSITVNLNSSTVFNTTAFDQNANTHKDDYAFGANVIDAGDICFDGNSCQYQLMVPTTASGTDTYYFFLEMA